MPHQCTNCGQSFADGSTEMLSGCPDCGGNKFQFKPGDREEPAQSAEPPEPPEPPGNAVSRTVGNAATTVRNFVGGGPAEMETPAPDDATGTVQEPAGHDAETIGTGDRATEDTAQAAARSELVSPDEIPASSWGPTAENTESVEPSPDPEPADTTEQSATEPADDRPDLAQLREELNEQFESIKVLSPGQYELNLMELYDREEYIIALQEDGRYTIQVPDTWHDA